MGKSQRTKGAVGEREAAALISKIFNTEASRSARNGVDAAEDVHHNIVGLHVEIKRVEKLNVPAALEKAKSDAKSKIPSLWHRRNRSEWLVTVYADDLLPLVHLIEAHHLRNAKTANE
jgi:hypothetical protein